MPPPLRPVYLGEGTPRQLGLAAVLGFASSSCSFAALAATRSLWTEGAALTAALAFMFASTNFAIEVAALAWIFLGWQYAAALVVGAPILIAVNRWRLTSIASGGEVVRSRDSARGSR